MNLFKICFQFLLPIVLVIGFGWRKPLARWWDFEEKFSEARPAKEKFEDIWSLLKSSGEENPPYFDIFAFLRTINQIPFVPGLNFQLMTSTSMFRPFNIDRKPLHTRPSYAWVKLTFNRESRKFYNGLFAEETVDYGLMAFSPGFKLPNITNFFAFSLRMFRDDTPASSIVAAFNFLSQANWNVFDFMVCTQYNWLMALPLALLGPLPGGQGWTVYFSQFGISNMAESNSKGERSEHPQFPFTLCFIPGDEVRKKSANMPAANEATQLLSKVQAGDKLYDVWAVREPDPLITPSLLGNYSHKIGELHTVSDFFTSTYGAQRLFGSHQRFESDLEYRPDWKPFAIPSILVRGGAAGVFSKLFPKPNLDTVNAEQNLLLLMAGVWKGFSSSKGFAKFLQQLGVTPAQIYDSVVNYFINEVIPLRVAMRSSSDYFSPTIKLSRVWALNSISNVAAYVRTIGIAPPVSPLRLGYLGRRAGTSIEGILDLVRIAGRGPICNAAFVCGNVTTDSECHHTCPVSWQAFSERAEKTTVETTLFKDVRVIPFHLKLFEKHDIVKD